MSLLVQPQHNPRDCRTQRPGAWIKKDKWRSYGPMSGGVTGSDGEEGKLMRLGVDMFRDIIYPGML